MCGFFLSTSASGKETEQTSYHIFLKINHKRASNETQLTMKFTIAHILQIKKKKTNLKITKHMGKHFKMRCHCILTTFHFVPKPKKYRRK